MNQSNRANPATVILMVAGIAICVGFIVHGIRGMSPEQATLRSAATTPTQAGSAQSGAPIAVTGFTNPAGAPVIILPQNAAGEVAESDLAPSADPFTPVGGWKAIPGTGVTPLITQAATVSPKTNAAPGLPHSTNSSNLAGFSIQEPELVGTLLGDKPSAVFRIDQRILTVAQGGQILGWKVVSIHQGEAELQGMGRTIRLTTGKPAVVVGKGSASLNTGKGPKSDAAAISSLPTS